MIPYGAQHMPKPPYIERDSNTISCRSSEFYSVARHSPLLIKANSLQFSAIKTCGKSLKMQSGTLNTLSLSSSYKLNILVSYTKLLGRERGSWKTTELFQLPHWCGPNTDLLMRNLNVFNSLQKFSRAHRPLVDHV